MCGKKIDKTILIESLNKIYVCLLKVFNNYKFLFLWLFNFKINI